MAYVVKDLSTVLLKFAEGQMANKNDLHVRVKSASNSGGQVNEKC